jgi:hypothetical protein
MPEPTKVDPIEAKYIEAENQITEAHRVLGELGKRELLARAAGAAPGTVITRASYDRIWTGLDETTKFLRSARDLASMPGSCIEAGTFKALGLSGCFSREQVAIIALSVISRLNKEML